MTTVTIIDYGASNMYSVQAAFEYLGAKVEVTNNVKKIITSAKVVLPGVGAFSKGMQALTRGGIDDALKEIAKKGTPLLGICLGMQMLYDSSMEFGLTTGLGLLGGEVKKINEQENLSKRIKIPHIGWSDLHPLDMSWTNTILDNLTIGASSYFVHSYMAYPREKSQILAISEYEGLQITAAVKEDNIYGCQFHPEKSGNIGLKILGNFLKL